jgi:hypothetical protein
LKIEFLEFFQFTYHFLSEAGRSDAAGAEHEKAKNALKRPISCTPGVELRIQRTDAHIRRRLRAIVLKHWKTKRRTAPRLIRLGIRRKTARQRISEGRQSIWALSHNPGSRSGTPQRVFRRTGAHITYGSVPEDLGDHPRPGAAWAAAGNHEAANRPVTGVITRHPEVPYANSASTVPWEVLGASRAPPR